MKLILIYSFWILAAPLFSADPTPNPQETSYLEKGLTQKNAGNYMAALQTWEEARTVLESPSLAIGREYIQLVTEQNFEDLFQNSSAMYLWGLSAQEVDPMVVDLEMKMLEPIVDSKDYKAWKNAFKEEPIRVLPLIQTFWLSQDPTPDSPYNERIVEHWERVAYVKENFYENSRSVYDTDERGPVYVKYGAPQKTDRNIRGSSEYRIELWAYTNHNVSPIYNNLFIFGDFPGQGFVEVATVFDFFQPRQFNSRNISNATLVAMRESVRQFAGFDPLLAYQYDRLLFETQKTTFGLDGVNAGALAIGFRNEFTSTARRIHDKAPEEVSTYEEEFPQIPMTLAKYRFLDDANKPFTIAYLESQPLGPLVLDIAHNEDSVFTTNSDSLVQALDFYTFAHGMQVRGNNWELLTSEKLYPEIIVDVEQDSPPSTTIFTVPYVAEDAWQVFYAQIKNNHPNTKPELNTPFPDNLRGLNSIREQQGQPLNTDTDRLEISDIIIGYDLRDDDGSTIIPFKASHNGEIPEGENLAFHYELYHLKQNPGGVARFEIEFEIRKKQRGLIRLLPNEAAFTLSLTQQSDEPYFKENLEVETSDLKTGTYTLEMNIVDLTTQQEITKKIEFEVKGE